MSLWSRITNVFRSDRLNHEIDEELESHIQEAIEKGRDPAEVRRAFGSTLRHCEESRDVRLLTRPLILDKGKTPEWAGATPLRCHRNRSGRSSPHVHYDTRCVAKGSKYAASHPEELRASRELRILRSGNLRQMRNRTRCGSFHATQRIGSVLLSRM
jgi:hypothetical protein